MEKHNCRGGGLLYHELSFSSSYPPLHSSSSCSDFLDNFYKLHDNPPTMIFDRGSIFLSQVWTKFLVNTKLLYSTSYYQKDDGQMEGVNQCLEQYLRCINLTSLTTRQGEFPLLNYDTLPLTILLSNVHHFQYYTDMNHHYTISLNFSTLVLPRWMHFCVGILSCLRLSGITSSRFKVV